MIKKIYKQIIKYIKENKGFVGAIILILVLSYIELPYYINAPGGLVDLDNKVVIDNEYESKGTLNMSYVTEYKPSILMLMYAFINPNCDIYKQEEYLAENDTKEDMLYREKLQMQEAVDNAIILGYTKAGKSVSIKHTDIYVTYILKEADTDIEVKDKILKVNNVDINSREDLNREIDSVPLNTEFNIEVDHEGETYTRHAKVTDIDGYKIIGITLTCITDYEVDPQVTFEFKNNESGPSGGLMTTLEIYNELTEEDITKGHKIAGTGTISIDGVVGEIGGVKYKLKGAVKNHADIFLVPSGDNYDEAIKEKEEHNYQIEIVSIDTFDDALNYLNNLSE